MERYQESITDHTKMQNKLAKELIAGVKNTKTLDELLIFERHARCEIWIWNGRLIRKKVESAIASRKKEFQEGKNNEQSK